MNRSRFTASVRVVAGLLYAASFAVTASAQSAHSTTDLTFSAPVRVPGITLTAGTYSFQRIESNRDTGAMQVFSVKPRRLVATLNISPISRASGGENVVFRMTSAGVAPTLSALYIDGGKTGVEFIYSDAERRQFARKAAVAKPATVASDPGVAITR